MHDLVADDLVEQPHLDMRRDDRHCLEHALAASPSRLVRPSTASRTVGGTSVPPPASTSVTKNGLPAVLT